MEKPEIIESPLTFKAYKGFDKNLKCRNFQFVVGETYSTANQDNPVICSGDGFHYCDQLKDVFEYYNSENGNRFCEIEILGQFVKHGDKSISTKIKILKEIPETEIDELMMDETMNLKTLQALQIQNPLLQIGGSVALYIYGIRLSRFKDKKSDFDLCMPYWKNIDENEQIKLTDEQGDVEKFYNNDFEETLHINGIKCDVCIDPKQRYSLKEYKGFTYRLAPFETIMEAKFRYAMRGNAKHKEDCQAICLGIKPKTLTEILNF